MRLQILHNQRYCADVVLACLLLEVWQKNNMFSDIWLYLFLLSIRVRNYSMNHKHELHLPSIRLLLSLKKQLAQISRDCR